MYLRFLTGVLETPSGNLVSPLTSPPATLLQKQFRR